MSTYDEALVWSDQFNDRRLLLIRKKWESGLDEPETKELDRLQLEAQTYADFLQSLAMIPGALPEPETSSP